MATSSADALKAQVREKYGQMAEANTSCCAPSDSEEVASGCAPSDSEAACMSESYDAVEGYTPEADLGLGCGLPTELAQIQPGERVIDLGSGAGLDAFVARRTVGAEGFVLGVDMTEQMVEKARQNAEKLGYDNVDFRLGDIEALPVEDDAFDLALSNCVLNLVPDKEQAFREIRRVLRPGGRFCISDIVSTGTLPEAVREAAALYAGCIGGALPKDAYLAIIRDAGFVDVAVAKERRIDVPDATLRPHLADDDLAAFRASGAGLLSVTVVGIKPAR